MRVSTIPHRHDAVAPEVVQDAHRIDCTKKDNKRENNTRQREVMPFLVAPSSREGGGRVKVFALCPALVLSLLLVQ